MIPFSKETLKQQLTGKLMIHFGKTAEEASNEETTRREA